MALIRRSFDPTDFVLPIYVGSYKTYWYYFNESDLFKAYYQLKRIKGKYKPLYPVVYGELKQVF